MEQFITLNAKPEKQSRLTILQPLGNIPKLHLRLAPTNGFSKANTYDSQSGLDVQRTFVKFQVHVQTTLVHPGANHRRERTEFRDDSEERKNVLVVEPGPYRNLSSKSLHGM